MSSTPDPDCLFCRIVAGDIPAEIVAETEHTVAFRDIFPQADVHVLVVPRVHEPDIGSLAAADPEVTVALLAEARRIAEVEVGGQYRLVFNTGSAAGQTVFHAHAHVLGGEIHVPLPG
ncbi:HIT domain-containing protein [Aeromicrobium stalagmiti]|uniref:HIT domain-containing protein n=1 Tax=Aeromicrobium stalagmiti TaxID=2738988 RepID=UPI003464A0CC